MNDLNKSMKVIKESPDSVKKSGLTEYDKLKTDLLGKHAKKMNEILDMLEPKVFASVYPKILDYVAPKTQRTRGKNESKDRKITVIYGDEKKSAS